MIKLDRETVNEVSTKHSIANSRQAYIVQTTLVSELKLFTPSLTYEKDGLENKHVLKRPYTDQSITYNTSPFQWVGAVVASVKNENI